ncbi:MAG TPA: S1/P1 nuclease [Thermoanaerobaculia bacterium]
MRTLRLAVLLAIVPIHLFAWGSKGHAVVAEIAERELSPTAAAQIRDLNFATPLRDIASLPDDWRGEEVSGVRPGDTGPLHYSNIPNESLTFDRARDCANDQCIVAAIERFESVLHDKSAPKERRREALIYLVHFVGDIHQPMHAAGGQVPDPEGGLRPDRGGNLVPVRYLGVESNLHRMWDSQLIEWGPETVDDYVDYLLKYEMRGRPVEELRRGTVVDWINESHYAAVNNAYDIADGRIGSDYAKRNIGVVYERLLRAGLRLGRMLEEALAP